MVRSDRRRRWVPMIVLCVRTKRYVRFIIEFISYYLLLKFCQVTDNLEVAQLDHRCFAIVLFVFSLADINGTFVDVLCVKIGRQLDGSVQRLIVAVLPSITAMFPKHNYLEVLDSQYLWNE